MSAFAPANYEEAKEHALRRAANRASRPIRVKTKPPQKRKKLISIKGLRAKVWTQFSIFIRTRGADSEGFNVCVTCDVRSFWRELQAGHWIHGRLDFEERQIHPQCAPCNYHWNTRVNIAYSVFMARTYGVEVMEELRLLSNTASNKLSRDELHALLDHYSALNQANPIVQLGR